MELYEENLHRNFHIDEHEFGDIFNGKSSDIFYVCSHNNPENNNEPENNNNNNEPGENHRRYTERRQRYLSSENERRNSIVDASGIYRYGCGSCDNPDS